jgi:hypothetical protein
MKKDQVFNPLTIINRPNHFIFCGYFWFFCPILKIWDGLMIVINKCIELALIDNENGGGIRCNPKFLTSQSTNLN